MTSSYLNDLDAFPLYKRLPNNKELIFVHIPKTAGTSIRRFFGFPRLVHSGEGAYKKHYTVAELEAMIPLEVWERAFTFAFVRNPWDRFYSFHRYRNGKRKRRGREPLQDFNSWVLKRCKRPKEVNNNLRPQVDWILRGKKSYQLDFIGRYENLQEGFEHICRQVSTDVEQLPTFNRSPGAANYRAAYQDKAKAALANFYQEDITTFGYEF